MLFLWYEIFPLLPLSALPSKSNLPAPKEKVLLKMINPAPCRSLNSLNDKEAFTRRRRIKRVWPRLNQTR